MRIDCLIDDSRSDRKGKRIRDDSFCSESPIQSGDSRKWSLLDLRNYCDPSDTNLKHIKSSDPTVQPDMDPHYFEDQFGKD